MVTFNKRILYNRPQIDPTDPWQFKNFLMTDGD
jgi:homospermidine synthase